MSIDLGRVSTCPCFILYIMSKLDLTKWYPFKWFVYLCGIHLGKFDCISNSYWLHQSRFLLFECPKVYNLTSGGARVFAVRRKRLITAPPIRSAIDILMVTTMSLARTVTNSTPSWWCNYVMQIPAESVLQCKRQFAKSGRISEFHISPFQIPPHCTVPPGAHVPLCPPSRRHWLNCTP